MGRPKGSKSKNQLDSTNIIETIKPVNNENDNFLVSPATHSKKLKTSVETRKKSKDCHFWNDLVGPPIEFFPKTKLPKTRQHATVQLGEVLW